MKGLITAHEHSYLKLKKGDEVLVLGITEYQPDVQHRYWMQEHIRHGKAGIKNRLLFKSKK